MLKDVASLEILQAPGLTFKIPRAVQQYPSPHRCFLPVCCRHHNNVVSALSVLLLGRISSALEIIPRPIKAAVYPSVVVEVTKYA